MGLGAWLDDRVNSRAVSASEKNIEAFAQRCDASAAFAGQSAELIASLLNELWPAAAADPVERIIDIRHKINRLHPDQMFDLANLMQKRAIALKKAGFAGPSAALAFLSAWVNIISIAERRQGRNYIAALRVAQGYESIMADLLALRSSSASS
jgi:hypothetical protein